MSLQTVTMNNNTTCNYWFTPEPVEASGTGVDVPAIVMGVLQGTPTIPANLSVQLDNSVSWDIRMDFQGAPPIVFAGLAVGSGGDLIALLTAQGWTQL